MKKLKDENLSKFLSQILRHKPEKVKIELDEFGYAIISELIANSRKNGYEFTKIELLKVVKTNEKQRFLIKNEKIKATKGHSFEVALETEPVKPPEILYYGIFYSLKEKIENEGINRMARNLVNLNEDFKKSILLSGCKRFDKPIIFEIRAKQMYNSGFKFYKSENNVWLTKYIKPEYIRAKELSDLFKDYQRLQIKSVNRYKILRNNFQLVDKQPNILILRGKNCYFCKDLESNLSFYENHIECGVIGYINKRKTHYLEGRLISKNVKREESTVCSKSICEIYLPKKNMESFDIFVQGNIFYSNGFNYLCEFCNQENRVFNLSKLDEKISCTKCKTTHFKVEQKTIIEIEKSQ